jgi:hypothetical protein
MFGLRTLIRGVLGTLAAFLVLRFGFNEQVRPSIAIAIAAVFVATVTVAVRQRCKQEQ